VLDWYLSRRFK